MEKRPSKVEQAREWLAREIRIGNFTRGSALPPERELADQIGVSYMTLRKAVGALVEEGLLTRNHGSGTFVRSEIPEAAAQKVLGLVMPAWSAPENLDTIMYYSKACEAANWLLKVIYVRGWADRSILDLWQSCDALVVTMIGEVEDIPPYVLEKIRSSGKPVVCAGGAAEYLGIDSVYYENDRQLEEPCRRLHELGHRRILLADQMTRRDGVLTSIHSHMSGFKEIFARKYPDIEYNTSLLTLEIPYFRQPHRLIREAIRERGGELAPYTAVICPLSFYWAVMSGLRDIGRSVPGDISVLAFGDRQEAEFYCPRPAVFSVLLQDHAGKALKLILRRLRHPDAPATRTQVDVQFIEGETITPVTYRKG